MHLFEPVLITDNRSPYYGRCGLIDWIYPRSVRVQIRTGVYPPTQIEVQNSGVSHYNHAAVIDMLRREQCESLESIARIAE